MIITYILLPTQLAFLPPFHPRSADIPLSAPSFLTHLRPQPVQKPQECRCQLESVVL